MPEDAGRCRLWKRHLFSEKKRAWETENKWSRGESSPTRPLTPSAEDPHSSGIRKRHIQDQLVGVEEAVWAVAAQHHGGHVLQVWREWHLETTLPAPHPQAPSSTPQASTTPRHYPGHPPPTHAHTHPSHTIQCCQLAVGEVGPRGHDTVPVTVHQQDSPIALRAPAPGFLWQNKRLRGQWDPDGLGRGSGAG